MGRKMCYCNSSKLVSVLPVTTVGVCVCLVAGLIKPHLAQLESGVGGATASPGPARVWGGWGYSLTRPS